MQKPRSPYTSGGGLGSLSTAALQAANFGGTNSAAFNPRNPNLGKTNFEGDGVHARAFLTQPQLPKQTMRCPKAGCTMEGGEQVCPAMEGLRGSSRIPFPGGALITPRLAALKEQYEGDKHMGYNKRSGCGNAYCLLHKNLKQQQNSTTEEVHNCDSTDSESEQFKYEYKDTEPSKWRAVFDLFMSKLSSQRQQKVETTLKRVYESAVTKYLLMLLQFIVVVMRIPLNKGQQLCLYFQLPMMRPCLWRLRSSFRSITRALLWRLTNCRTDDIMLFFFVVLATPWMFLVGLIGFIVSFTLLVIDFCTDTWLNIRLRMFF